jgi:hypothetical protein
LLRIHGRFYELSQETLRIVLGLPFGPPGLGVSIDQDRLSFEFPADDRLVEITADQLHRRLAKQLTGKGHRS